MSDGRQDVPLRDVTKPTLKGDIWPEMCRRWGRALCVSEWSMGDSISGRGNSKCTGPEEGSAVCKE